ncbi:MAG: DUF4102 domain-containing protein [Caulobacter sp.]|nr:DUF4102 domain-containing protein [Caulobacter sp.]
MGRTLHRLKAKQVEALGPGRHADGGGLYLVRDKEGRSRWVFMWNRGGVRREMGLGSAAPGGVSLAKARAKADQARNILEDGGDPIEVRNSEAAAPVRIPTFGELADEYVEAQSPQWRNEKHRAQWAMTLSVYAQPLRSLPVDQVTTTAVMAVLNLCRTAFDILIERAGKNASAHGRRLRVKYEGSNVDADHALRAYFAVLKAAKGLQFDAGRAAKYSPMNPVELAGVLIDIERKDKRSKLMQIADSYVYAIARGGYESEFPLHANLRDSGRLIDASLSDELRPSMGIKYSCFDHLVPETAKAEV